MRFRPLQRVPTQSSGMVDPGLPRLDPPASSGFRNLLTLFSALESVGLISCRIRSWGLTLQSLPLLA